MSNINLSYSNSRRKIIIETFQNRFNKKDIAENDIEGLVKLRNFASNGDNRLFFNGLIQLRKDYPIIKAMTKPRFSLYDWLRNKINEDKEIKRRVQWYKNIIDGLNNNLPNLFHQSNNLSDKIRTILFQELKELELDKNKVIKEQLLNLYNNINNINISVDSLKQYFQQSSNKIIKKYKSYKEKLGILHQNQNKVEKEIFIQDEKGNKKQININKDILILNYQNEKNEKIKRKYISFRDNSTQRIFTYPLPEYINNLNIKGGLKKCIASNDEVILFEFTTHGYSGNNDKLQRITNVLLKNKVKTINVPGLMISEKYNLIPNVGYIDLLDYINFIKILKQFKDKLLQDKFKDIKDIYIIIASIETLLVNMRIKNLKGEVQSIISVLENNQYFGYKNEKLNQEINKLSKYSIDALQMVYSQFNSIKKIMFCYDWFENNFIRNKCNLSIKSVISITNFMPLLKDLKTIHQNNLFHLDIKLNNIMINKDLSIRLIDVDNMQIVEQDKNIDRMISYSPFILHKDISNAISEGKLTKKHYQIIDEYTTLITMLRMLNDFNNFVTLTSYGKTFTIDSLDENIIDDFVKKYIKELYRKNIMNFLQDPLSNDSLKDNEYLYDKFNDNI